MAEWLKAADCKSAHVSVRWFESSSAHHLFLGSNIGRCYFFMRERRVACICYAPTFFAGFGVSLLRDFRKCPAQIYSNFLCRRIRKSALC